MSLPIIVYSALIPQVWIQILSSCARLTSSIISSTFLIFFMRSRRVHSSRTLFVHSFEFQLSSPSGIGVFWTTDRNSFSFCRMAVPTLTLLRNQKLRRIRISSELRRQPIIVCSIQNFHPCRERVFTNIVQLSAVLGRAFGLSPFGANGTIETSIYTK
jgi:hypothetical protein